jgi:hypothetical protein
MTKLQSSLDVVIEMLRDLEEFERSGSKGAFRKQLREEFVLRSGAASTRIRVSRLDPTGC